LRFAQRHLAKTLTELVHGAEVESQAATVAAVLFGAEGGAAASPRSLDAAALSMLAAELPSEVAPQASDATLVDLVLAAGFATSKSEARRLIEQGGISVNGEGAADPTTSATHFAPLADGSLLLRKGRRDYRILRAR
jgi:tyrosyl-tRNA synthetase